MKQWKRICALVMSVLSVGSTMMGAGCGSTKKKGHSHSWETEIITEATCTEKGKKKKTCEDCGEVDYASIPAKGHEYENGVCINGCGSIDPSGNDSSGSSVEEGIGDQSPAWLSVATFDGGVGKAWLEDAIVRFEEMHKDTVFVEGTKGVKISLYGDKNKYSGDKLAESVMDKDMYFTEAVEYYTMVNNGQVADITDVVTGSLSAYGESGTIEDKIDATTKAFMTAKDGNYYMIPFYDGFYGLIYDVELFDEVGFYFDKDGDFTKDKSQFANGPDGVAGTYDDGLPATYDQMIKLCDRIVDKGYTPFLYSGNYPGYVNRAFYSWAADYEGYDAFSLNKTFNGTAKLAKSITPGVGMMEATIEFEEVAITENNGYELQRQAGKYYALAMQEALFGSTKYIGGSFNGLDYTVAQANFIKGKYQTATTKRYAMLAEGVWWENEANPAFAELEALKGEGKMDRKFGFMPVPKVNEAAAGEQTMYSANRSFGFINKDCQNMELAKEFMKFLHTDAEMSKFTAKTSIPRSLDYEVSAADRENATYFGKTLIDMRANADVVYSFASSNIAIQNPVNFENDVWFGYSMIGSQRRNNALGAFKDGKATALEYFNGLYDYQKSVWSSLKR